MWKSLSAKDYLRRAPRYAVRSYAVAFLPGVVDAELLGTGPARRLYVAYVGTWHSGKKQWFQATPEFVAKLAALMQADRVEVT